MKNLPATVGNQIDEAQRKLRCRWYRRVFPWHGTVECIRKVTTPKLNMEYRVAGGKWAG